MLYKYPRTPLIPWSEKGDEDDIYIEDLSVFDGREVVVTIKLDGECTSFCEEKVFARSINSGDHISRHWSKALWSTTRSEIPTGFRFCGENLTALHSIFYTDLPTYLFLFAVFDENNTSLCWDSVVEWKDLLNSVLPEEFKIDVPPVLYRGIWDIENIKSLWPIDVMWSTDHERDGMKYKAQEEGYVVRLAGSYHYNDFAKYTCKFVRKNHIVKNSHWMHGPIIKNLLAKK